MATSKKTTRTKLAPVVREIAATTDYQAFPEVGGFSTQNLRYLRWLCQEYNIANAEYKATHSAIRSETA